MVTLSWIKAQGKEFKTFVQHRIQEIQKNSNTNIGFTPKAPTIQQIS